MRKFPGSRIQQVVTFAFTREASSTLPIASVKVTRDTDSAEAVLRELAAEVMRGNVDAALSSFLAAIVPRLANTGKLREVFPIWERHGFHVTPVHFYQPIPDTQTLPQTLWNSTEQALWV